MTKSSFIKIEYGVADYNIAIGFSRYDSVLTTISKLVKSS